MFRRKADPLWLIVAIGGFLYPLLVYAGLGKVPSALFIIIGLGAIVLRLMALRKNASFKLWSAIFAIASLLLIAGLFLFPHYAVQAYPVVISLSVASAFGISLFFPPTLVERIARLSEPDLPPEGVIYTRRVTVIWFFALLINAAISAALAIWGTLAQWTLWNGLLSYLAMGLLFAGEYAVRKMVRR